MTSAADLAKLKVAELKELLKAKDLPTAGVKQELIDRLLAVDSAPEKPQAATEPAAPTKPEKPAAAAAAKPSTAAAAAKSDAQPVAVEQPAEPAAEHTSAPAKAGKAAASHGTAKQPAAEAHKPTEQKGSQPVSLEERRKERAARFGVPVVASEPGAADESALASQLDKRRERFGAVQPEAAARKGGRKEAAEAPSAPSAEEQQRIDKRKARFGEVSKEAPQPGKRVRAAPDAGKSGKPSAREGKGQDAEVAMSAELKAKLESRGKRFAAVS